MLAEPDTGPVTVSYEVDKMVLIGMDPVTVSKDVTVRTSPGTKPATTPGM